MRRYELFEHNAITHVYDRKARRHYTLKEGTTTEALEAFVRANPSCFRLALFPGKVFQRASVSRRTLLILIACSLASACCVIPCLVIAIASAEVEFPSSVFDNLSSIAVLMAWCLINVFLHEAFHALAGSCFGGYVAEIGFGQKRDVLKCQTKMIWTCDNPKELCIYYFAGSAASMMLSASALGLYYATSAQCFIVLSICSLLIVAIDLCPFIPGSDAHSIYHIWHTERKSRTH